MTRDVISETSISYTCFFPFYFLLFGNSYYTICWSCIVYLHCLLLTLKNNFWLDLIFLYLTIRKLKVYFWVYCLLIFFFTYCLLIFLFEFIFLLLECLFFDYIIWNRRIIGNFTDGNIIIQVKILIELNVKVKDKMCSNIKLKRK